MSRIYVLDDHEMIRDGLCHVLKDAGHFVVGTSGSVCQARTELQRQEVDLLLLDLNLEDGNTGLEGLVSLRQIQPQMRVLVLTMSAQPHHVKEALRLGASGYLLKGSPSSELLKAIDCVMHGKGYLSDRIAPLATKLASNVTTQPLDKLSRRELEILNLVVQGRTSAAIARALSLSPKTVDTYRSRLMIKLNLCDLPSLVRFAIQHGLLPLDAKD